MRLVPFDDYPGETMVGGSIEYRLSRGMPCL
jgi:hypothetical protein